MFKMLSYHFERVKPPKARRVSSRVFEAMSIDYVTVAGPDEREERRKNKRYTRGVPFEYRQYKLSL